MIKKIALIGIWCLVVAAFALGIAPHASAKQRADYVIAVIPSAPPVDMHTQWTPFVERLSRGTGQKFRVKVYERMSEFEQDIWRGGPDFIFASPIQTVVAHETNRYMPLLRGNNLVSVRLIVRRDSPIKTIDDLAGKKIAFVGNKNLCSVFVRHMLHKQRDKLTYLNEFTGSTRNVLKSVLLGKTDAGAVFVPELERESEESRQQFRSLLDTPKIAPHPLSAHPRVPSGVQEAVKKAVFTMAGTRDGAELLKTLRLGSPIIADYERDYRALEEVDVKGLTNWGR